MVDNDRMLVRFMEESNRIEGIYKVTRAEYASFEAFLKLDEVTIADLCVFVKICAGSRGVLRLNHGMDVEVGDHVPPPGGPKILHALDNLLDRVNDGTGNPYEIHHDYLSLHPFLDGNGRSGRALWAWQMVQGDAGVDALGLGFLHEFYYQALEAADREHR